MRFTKDHEWVELEGDVAIVGITAYAAEQLGDVYRHAVLRRTPVRERSDQRLPGWQTRLLRSDTRAAWQRAAKPATGPGRAPTGTPEARL